MRGKWADFEPITAIEAGNTAIVDWSSATEATGTKFQEWDKGGFRKPRLPIGLKLDADTRTSTAVATRSKTDEEANHALWIWLKEPTGTGRQSGDAVVQYFSSHPDLIRRLAKVRIGAGKLTQRLNAEFQGSFEPNEVAMLAALVPITQAQSNNQNPSTHEARLNSAGGTKAHRRARQAQKAADRLRERTARQHAEFREKCDNLAAAGDPDAIVDFAMANSQFEKILGAPISKVISSTQLEEPPDLIWKEQSGTIVWQEHVRSAVAAVCMERWKSGRAAYLLALKRSASALKAAETRRIRTAAKREVEEAAARVKFAEDRLAALPGAHMARAKGPDALLDLLATNEAARSLLTGLGEDGPLLVLTESEIEADKRRKQAKIDERGIWRKDIHQMCPWISDSEIELLYKQGYIKVIRTEKIKKNGQWINARLYDPVTVRQCTKAWMEIWRTDRKLRKAAG
jgi:hypothetical protein